MAPAETFSIALPPGVTLPPGMSIADLPAMRPPPGVTSNFTNPETSTAGLMAVNWFFTSLAALMTLIRVVTRGILKREQGYGWDDGKLPSGILKHQALTVDSSDRASYGKRTAAPALYLY
jgi:hypothetical protein